jgi:hypothetical protein
VYAVEWQGTEEGRRAREEAAGAARLCAVSDPRYAARAWMSAANAEGWLATANLPRHVQVRPTWAWARKMACLQIADLLRDVFNPCGPAVHLDDEWLRWDRGTVRNMAEGIYADRDFERLPILADALEEAGCTEQHLLAHLRQPGVHIRGCWALDAVLGKTASEAELVQERVYAAWY